MKSERIVEIPEMYRKLIRGDFRWQVCFKSDSRLAVNNMQIEPDLHDWIIMHTKHPVKVHEESVWFTDSDEAILCHMRFSSGS